MSVFSEQLRSKIEGYLGRYETKRSSILPILHAIQDELGHVSEAAVDELEAKFGLHRVQVKEVVTFYDIYHSEPQPKYLIRYCKNLTCHIMGAQPAMARIRGHIETYRQELGDDCPFGLEEFPCLGKCDGAPVMLVNKDRLEHATVDRVDDMLAKYAPLPKSRG